MEFTRQSHTKVLLILIFISGIVIGGSVIGSITYFFLSFKIPKNIPVTDAQGIGFKFSSTNKNTADNTQAEDPKISVKKDNKKIYIKQVLDTSTATHESLVTLDRDKLKQMHTIGIGAIYLDDTLTAKLYYKYHKYSFEVLGGYNIENKKGVWGLGFGIELVSW